MTYTVQVEFDPGAAAVKAGMSATADIQIEHAMEKQELVHTVSTN